jgi:UDP-2,3-diacylglucosamine hydrolase
MDLFASDLHLSSATPDLNAAFIALLDGRARNARRVFLLGDVFEVWAGDEDAELPEYRPVIAALRALTDAGIELHLLPGNRDFLLGAGFAAATGARLHGDWLICDLAGTQALLMHGDTLCTDDLPYQQFRRMVRAPQWQAAFLARPLAERHAIADDLRRKSQQATAGKAMEILDANDDAIASVLRHHDVSLLIHGHTHRPARHLHDVDGAGCTRWVIADWRDRACWLEAGEHDVRAFTTDEHGAVVPDLRYR